MANSQLLQSLSASQTGHLLWAGLNLGEDQPLQMAAAQELANFYSQNNVICAVIRSPEKLNDYCGYLMMPHSLLCFGLILPTCPWAPASYQCCWPSAESATKLGVTGGTHMEQACYW